MAVNPSLSLQHPPPFRHEQHPTIPASASPKGLACFIFIPGENWGVLCCVGKRFPSLLAKKKKNTAPLKNSSHGCGRCWLSILFINLPGLFSLVCPTTPSITEAFKAVTQQTDTLSYNTLWGVGVHKMLFYILVFYFFFLEMHVPSLPYIWEITLCFHCSVYFSCSRQRGGEGVTTPWLRVWLWWLPCAKNKKIKGKILNKSDKMLSWMPKEAQIGGF